jgi:hypothetical protein
MPDPNDNLDPNAAPAAADPGSDQPDDTYQPLDEEMVQAVATSMARAHHGPDVQGNDGYLQAARTFVAGAMAVHEYGAPRPPASAETTTATQ